jgi:hypothetical protein
MAKISATDAKNKIGELWALAEHEPVIVEFNGVPKFQVSAIESYATIPKEEYERVKNLKKVPQFGFAKEYLAGLDVDALLSVDISDQFEGSL